MTTGNNNSTPNPDEIYIPDPGYNVIVYNGECYSRTDGRGPIDTMTGYPHEGYNTCIDCFAVNPTPTPTPTLTYPAPALVGFPFDISSHIEGVSVVVEVHRLDGFGIPFEVDYEITPLSAVENVDYSLPEGSKGTLRFEDVDNIQYIKIDLELDHDLTELDELLHVNLLEARSLAPRTQAKIEVGKELRIVQVQESGLPPSTTLSAGDIYDIIDTTLNIKFDAATGQDAIINLYPDYNNDPGTYFVITVGNDGGDFVWDKNDTIGSYHLFPVNVFPVSHTFDVFYANAGKDITYTITYIGPGSFYFNVECPPTATPLPGSPT